MKTWKKLLVSMAVVLLMAVLPVSSLGSLRAEAAAKKGLVKSGGKYYYYSGGKKIKKKWKNIKVKENGKKVTYRYYFGKDGAAYAAKKVSGMKKNIVAKKIGSKTYGFDRYGHMMKGVCATSSGKIYFFNNKGVWNKTKSKQYNSAAKYGKNAATIRKLLGTPLKEKTSDSCYLPGQGVDVQVTYENVVLSLFRYNNGTEIVFGVFPR